MTKTQKRALEWGKEHRILTPTRGAYRIPGVRDLERPGVFPSQTIRGLLSRGWIETAHGGGYVTSANGVAALAAK